MPKRPIALIPRRVQQSHIAAVAPRRIGRRKGVGYDAAWERLRSVHLHDNPLCAACLVWDGYVAAEHVDHIEPIRLAPDRRLDPSNLQSLCRPCHSRKTYLEQRGQPTDLKLLSRRRPQAGPG
jgi:5-methylcytosine-specific restriction endonuclease McrA